MPRQFEGIPFPASDYPIRREESRHYMENLKRQQVRLLYLITSNSKYRNHAGNIQAQRFS